ncbi:MAG: hypothetical protein D6781_04540 [Verrucomicrobia bacterium]|nr:MAG: hypothetical protein D6781_04540 [Verrucomicrobiota bacterium]
MPQPTNVRLTREQEEALIRYLDKRIDSLKETNRERIEADADSWRRYNNDRSDRTGGVWDHCNTPLPLTSMVVDYFSARAHDELLSSRPFFQITPQGPADRDFAQTISRFSTYKLNDVARTHEEIDQALLSAFVQRAAILKAVYHEERDSYERVGVIALHDAQTGAPVEILDYGFILEDAEWVEQPDPINPGQSRLHLAADPSFILDPERYEWKPLEQPVAFERTLYAGPRSVQVDSQRFLAPITARSLDEADCIVEFYDRTLDWVMERFNEREWLKAKDYRAELASEDAEEKTPTQAAPEGSHPIESKSESLSFDPRTKRIAIAECWLTWDVFDRGTPSRIVVWMDIDRRKLIACEYQAIVSPTGKPPYSAITVARKPNRWWGPSIPEMVKAFQDYVDGQFNRHSYRNLINANPVIGQNPDAIIERKEFLDIGPGEAVTLEDGRSISDYLQAFVFPNADLDTEMLLDKCVYFVQLWLGISNVAQGDYSDVPQNTTAFGQDATLREAAKLARRFIRRCIAGIEHHITHLAKILFATMDDEEVYYYTEGDTSSVGSLTADAVRNLELNIRISVGRTQNAQAIQATTLAKQIVTEYVQYLAQAPQIAATVRPIYKQSLRLLGFDDVDALLPDPSLPEGAALMSMPPPDASDVPESARDQQNLAPFPDAEAANTAASIVTGPPPVLNRNQPQENNG